MNRAPFGSVLVAGGLLAGLPPGVDAQLVVQVGLSWEWSDDGWRAYQPAYERSRRDVHYSSPREVVYYTQRRAVKVPRGHLPPPGYCRAWYPGVPPGHQPRPGRCERIFREHRNTGAVILGGPGYFGAAAFGDDDRGFRDGRRGRGRR